MNSDVQNRFIWLNEKIVRLEEATINVLSPTSQFGLNVFEGIRCYWNEEQNELYAFRLDDHFRRLKNSQKMIQIEDKYTLEELKKAFIDVIKANNYKEDISVRQTIFVDGFGSWSSREKVNMFVSPIPKSNTSAEYNKKGLRSCISSWRRINDNSLSPKIKCGANYINSRMAQRQALNDGYDTAIFLNNHGYVSEAPGSCIFIVRNGKLITPMITDSVLESITRDTVIELSRKELKIEVEERTIDRTELYISDEVFLCGSAMEITPVLEIDKYLINEGVEGEITKSIHDKYLEIVRGNNYRYKSYLTKVYG